MMPNHVTNILICSGGYDFNCEEFKAKYEGTNFCSMFKPLPDVLANIVAGGVPCRYVHRETGKVHEGCNGPMGNDREQYERVELSEADQDALILQCGASNWYDWQNENWGTKWGTYGELKAVELGGDSAPILISFETAWSEPNADMRQTIMDWLSKENGFYRIAWCVQDPGNDEFKIVHSKAFYVEESE